MISIKQYIAEKLLSTEIFEMAEELSEYRNDINSMLPIIVAYILLIMKSREEDNDEFIDHCKKEIRGFMRNLCKKKIKIKDNYSTRYKHIYDIIIRRNELDTNDDFIWSLNSKLHQEGYDLEDKNIYEEFIDLFHKFQEEYLSELIDVLAKRDFELIKIFVNKF